MGLGLGLGLDLGLGLRLGLRLGLGPGPGPGLGLAAQTNHVAQEHLLGRFDADLMGDRLTIAGDDEAPLGTKAPGNSDPNPNPNPLP